MHDKYFKEIKRQSGGSFNRAHLESRARKLASREARLVSDNDLSQTQVDRFAGDLVRYLRKVPEPLTGNMEKVYEKAFKKGLKEEK